MTSEQFDEPRCLALVEASDLVLGVHGRRDRNDGWTVWMGGADAGRRDRIATTLRNGDFAARTDGHTLAGTSPDNICNRGRSGAGVQLEIPMSLRDALCCDAARLDTFAAAVRTGLAGRAD